jgi:hypothetical protein
MANDLTTTEAGDSATFVAAVSGKAGALAATEAGDSASYTGVAEDCLAVTEAGDSGNFIGTVGTLPAIPIPPTGVGTDVDADVVYDMVYAIANSYVMGPPNGVPSFKTIAGTPMRIVPPETDLPYLGVYMREQAKAYTYGIAATPQMWNTLSVCCSGVIRYSDADKQFAVLRAMMKGLNTTILTHPSFNALGVHYSGYTRRFRHTQLNSDALAELTLEYTFEYRTVYPPAVTDDYRTLHITREIHGSAGPTVVHEGSYEVGTEGEIITGTQLLERHPADEEI